MSEFQFDLSGDHLAVNFADTVDKRHTPSPIERLVDYRSLVAFARQSGALPAARAHRLAAWADGAPAQARLLLDDALRLRDALYRLFADVAAKRKPDARDLAELNRWAKRLELDADLKWQWAAGANAPDALMAPIVEAALALLTDDKCHCLRICEADDCLWVFLDTSKNRTRRWCDMKSCGNRMKARRYLARQRAPRGQKRRVKRARNPPRK